MKKYIIPSLVISTFTVEDIMATSGIDAGNYTTDFTAAATAADVVKFVSKTAGEEPEVGSGAVFSWN